MNSVLLIARREVVVRLQQKGFRIGFLVALVIFGVGAAAPAFIGGGTTTYDIAVAGPAPNEFTAALEQAAKSRGDRIAVHRVDAPTAEAKVRSGDWDAAFIDGKRIVAQTPGSEAVNVIEAAHNAGVLQQNLVTAGLTPNQVERAFDIPTLAVVATKSAQSTQRQAVSTIAVVFFFAQLITYCSWVAIGVVEEKSSRVVELILSSVRPTRLLAGKLIGIGGLAVAQVAILGSVALGVAAAVGSLSLPTSAYISLLVAFGWFILGFAFFAATAAGLAALVSRQEEVSGVLTPVTGLLFVSYAASFAVAANPDSTLSRWLAIIPPISSIAMPARLARGGVPVIDVLLAAVLMIAVTVAAIAVAGRLYRAAILHSGSKLSLRAAWRGEAVGEPTS